MGVFYFFQNEYGLRIFVHLQVLLFHMTVAHADPGLQAGQIDLELRTGASGNIIRIDFYIAGNIALKYFHYR